MIADLTDSNPNAFYELGITHALGRACVAVMESRQQKIEFDIAAYRVFKLNLDEERYLEAQCILRDPIEGAHRSISDWSTFENPVIDFFRAPITSISPAFAEWCEIEDQEIQRFSIILQMFINRHEDNPDFSSRVKIYRYDPTTPGDLGWLYSILQN